MLKDIAILQTNSGLNAEMSPKHPSGQQMLSNLQAIRVYAKILEQLATEFKLQQCFPLPTRPFRKRKGKTTSFRIIMPGPTRHRPQK